MTQMIVYILLFIALFFEVFVLLVFLEYKEEMLDKKTRKAEKLFPKSYNLPFVSIMVPAFNEERTVAKTLDSLLALNYPKEKFEILVIDDGSTDNTYVVAKAYTTYSQIRILQKENGGKHTALNYGLMHTKGEIVGCLDADSFVDKDALLHIVSYFKDRETMAVVPAIKIHEPQTIIQHIQATEYMFGVFLRKILSFIGSIYITPGPFSFFRREVFEIIGPYRHAYNTEDLEIGLRMQEKHLKIANAHNAVVSTVSPRTIRTLYKQRVRWTYGFLRNARDYYKKFFFRKEHGHLGMLILPMSAISVYSTIYFTGSFVTNTIQNIIKSIGIYNATGWYVHMPSFEFNWFFLKTGAEIWVAIIMALCSLSIIVIGTLVINKGKFEFTRGLIYCTLFYAFLAPLWLTSAAWKALLAKSPAWR